MPKRNLVEAINRGLMEEMERDPAVVILGEDVGREGGVFRVTDGLQARFGADRVIDTPLAESMGDAVEPRRQFIEENALNVRNLDI